MTFKINIGTKEGKTYKLEVDSEELMEKSLGDNVSGKDIYPELDGYEFKITGTSDSSGFSSREDVEGIGLKKVLLTYGKGMHKRSKREGKKKRSNPTPGGLKLRKTVRGKVISPAIVQINLKLIKEGSKKLKDIFPDAAKEPAAESK
jgi:small subunit ribosomal protein S6e